MMSEVALWLNTYVSVWACTPHTHTTGGGRGRELKDTVSAFESCHLC